MKFISTTDDPFVTIQIGKTGIYQVDNLRICSLKYVNDKGNFRPMEPNVIIDYIIQEV